MKKRTKQLVMTAAIAAGLWVGAFSSAHKLMAGGETRNISLYHIHTKESLTVTYMVNGKYVPSAMKKINYLLRDWRRNEVIAVDPRTIDLMWELHADLGSKAPVHIVCGYRSPKTNAFLKRVGRNVARKSQHMLGKAIDIYFPDIDTKTMRNSALVRQVGGVGYYRGSAGPTGFLHIDSGHVRHWGPAISNQEMASIFSKYRKTIGARLTKSDRVMVATRESGKAVNLPSGPSIYDNIGDDDDTEDAQVASAAPVKAANKQPVAAEVAAAEDEQLSSAGSAIPKPRTKPIEVLMMAAATMRVQPASAPPPNQVEGPGRLAGGVAYAVVERPAMVDEAMEDSDPMTNTDGKGSFAENIGKPHRNVAKPVIASAGSDGWWPQGHAAQTSQPRAAVTVDANAMPEGEGEGADGKGDLMVLDRSGKGNLPAPLPALING